MSGAAGSGGLLVVVVSAKGSPGVSTACLGLAATWPHGWSPVVVEADPSGGDVGTWHGLDAEPGLVGLAAASRRTGRADLVWEHARELPGGLPVVIAPAGPEQASAAVDVLSGCPDLGFLTSAVPRPDPADADRLAYTRAAADTDGRTDGRTGGWTGAVEAGRAVVVVDAGRLPVRVSRTSGVGRMLAAADVVLLVAGTDASGVVHTAAAAEALASLGDPAGLEDEQVPERRVRLLLAGRGPYGAREVTAALGLPVAGRLPWDERTAAALAGRSTRPVHAARSGLLRALAGIAHDLAADHSAIGRPAADGPALGHPAADGSGPAVGDPGGPGAGPDAPETSPPGERSSWDARGSDMAGRARR